MTPLASRLVVSLAIASIAVGHLRAQTTSSQTQTPQAQTQGQSQTPPATTPQTATTGTTAATNSDPAKVVTDLPVDVGRIKAGLRRPQPIHFDDQNLRFYMLVKAPPVTFMSLVGHFDLMKGPAPRAAAMSGREFIDMTTPKEMYSAAGIKPTDMLQFALTNWAAQTLVRRAYEDIKAAKSQKEIDEIRARIDKELAALMGKGGG